MNAGLLRRAWPSIGRGMALGCGAAFAGSCVFTLLALSLTAISDLMRGVPWQVVVSLREFILFILVGVALCFIVAAVPGSLGGGAIGLALHILAPRSTSLSKLGVGVGCFAGGLAGAVSVLIAFPLPGFTMMAERVLLATAIGIAVLAGGGAGRWLASHESARIARHANGDDSRDQDRLRQ